MSESLSTVTIHMAASLDGFIARQDGSVDWMEVADHFENGEDMSGEDMAQFLGAIDCYVMGSHTYETALGFEAKGLGWAYGETPVVVLTHRTLPKTRATVDFYAGDLGELLTGQLRLRFATIWIAGGGAVAGECLQRGLADEVRYSILPVAIGSGIPFFHGLDRSVALHLVEVKAYKSGIVSLRHRIQP